jgi:hypothetical protein
MEFIRKIFGRTEKQPDAARGVAPVQSQEQQDETRSRMEAEMAQQKERRDAPKSEA